jgi:hypothetical protein
MLATLLEITEIPMIPLDMILAPLVAFLVGIVAAMIGIGGGVFIVPFLTLISGFSPQHAVGTSLAMIIFTSVSSTVRYSRQRRIDFKVGLVLTIATIPGAFLGAHLTTLFTAQLLGLAFGFFLIFVAIRMALPSNPHQRKSMKMRGSWHRKITDSEGNIFEYDANVIVGLALSFFGGISSGLLGIGGGSLIVPILHLTMGLPIHVTVATSMFIMIFTSISGVATHLSIGNVHMDYAILLALGVIFGAQLGAHVSQKVSGKHLRRLFAVVLLVVSVRMILKFM